MNTLFLILNVLCCLIFTSIFAEESISVDELRHKINLLGPQASFTYIDLNLKEEELRLLDKIKFDNLVQSNSQYALFGNIQPLLEELPIFLRSMGNDDEAVVQTVTYIIYRVSKQMLEASNKESAWVCVRTSTPHPAFDTPRWHIDGSYFGPYPYPELVFKFAAVLKGPSTLLYNIPTELRNVFHENQEDRMFLKDLINLEDTESPKKGQGVLFIVGDANIGAVHSEPKLDENRLFFSVLVGCKGEIEELYNRWHTKG